MASLLITHDLTFDSSQNETAAASPRGHPAPDGLERLFPLEEREYIIQYSPDRLA